MLKAAEQEYAKAIAPPRIKRISRSRSSTSQLSFAEKRRVFKNYEKAEQLKRRQANEMLRVMRGQESRAAEEHALKIQRQEADLFNKAQEAPLKEKATETAIQAQEIQNKIADIKRMKEGLNYASTFLPKVRQDTYQDWHNWLDEQQWLPPGVLVPPEEVRSMTPEEFDMYKASLATNMTSGEVNKQVSKIFAPDIKERRHPETGEIIRVDERNPFEVQQAEQLGYKPIGPRSKAFLTGEGKYAADAYKTLTQDAKKARQSIATLRTMESLLDRFKSGKLANVAKNIQQWGDALGIPVDMANLNAKEAFLAFANQLALQSRNLGEGMVLAGQMSDQDVKFLKDMNPQLIISKGGNKLIIKIRERLAQRRAQIAKEAAAFKKQNKGYFDPTAFENYIASKYTKENIFGIPTGAVKVGRNRKTGLPVYEYNGKYIEPDI
jgi:hypothetical protein